MPVENGAGFLTRRTQAIVHAAVTGDEVALEAALSRAEPGDGSKEGWGPSNEAEALRTEFAELFALRYEDGSSPFDVVSLRFGGDFKHGSGIRAVDPRGPVPAELP